jgi:hypothetical protein
MLSEKRRLTHRQVGQLLGITQRTICIIHQLYGGRFSPRKLIPVNPKTLGDHLLLKRIEANLSQPEAAVRAGVSTRTVWKWEHAMLVPATIIGRLWHIFCAWILRFQKTEIQQQGQVLGFTQSNLSRCDLVKRIQIPMDLACF